jgi:hypothetical protein
MKKEGGRFFVVSLYVDDLIFTGNDLKLCAEFKASMQSEFDMTDLGRMKYFWVLRHIKQRLGSSYVKGNMQVKYLQGSEWAAAMQLIIQWFQELSYHLKRKEKKLTAPNTNN